jgi:hypothetical protein
VSNVVAIHNGFPHEGGISPFEKLFGRKPSQQVSSIWMFDVCFSTRKQTHEAGQQVNSVHSSINSGALELSRLRPGYQEGVRQSTCLLGNRVFRVHPNQEEQSLQYGEPKRLVRLWHIYSR